MRVSLSKTLLALSLTLTLSSCAQQHEQPSPSQPSVKPETKTATIQENEALPKYKWNEVHGWNRTKIYLQNDASENKPLPMQNVEGRYYSTPGESYSVCAQNNTDLRLGLALSRQGLDTNGKPSKPMDLIHILGPNTIRCFANIKFNKEAIPVVSWKLYNISDEQKEEETLAKGAVFAGQGAIYLDQKPLAETATPWSAE